MKDQLDISEVLINPLNYIIKENDFAILLAKSEEETNVIWNETNGKIYISKENFMDNDWISNQNNEQESIGELDKSHYVMWESN